MGLLDGVLGSLLGGNTNAGPLQSILGSLLGGGGGTSGGLGSLLERFQQAGYGGQANSWVGTGANQPIEPSALERVLGRQQIDQWSQQTGMAHGDLLSSLSNLLPHAVDRMTPDGQVPTSPFDGAGTELPPR